MSAPGAVNAHTHLYSGLAPFGLPAPTPPPENFVQILERLWWRLDRALDDRSLRASARFYVARSLLAGTTALVDHHESPAFIEGSLDVLADACQELGVRALVCYGATERNGGREEGRRGLAECARFLRENRRPLVRGAVALHASFTVSDETVRECGAIARELGAPVHVHVAEDAADVADARERGFDGPLERLLALGALPPGSIVAHGVHLSEAQVRRARDAGLWLVHNPRSNANNKVGYSAALVASDRVALGTDGFPADMGEELAALAAEGRAHGQDPGALAARLPAGRALVAELFGGEVDDAVTRSPGEVAEVSVAGRAVVVGGKLVSGDPSAIEAEARQEAARLFERMRSL
jgi:cytosine/adenosine deaminase-related metal-dependent hydrolase